MKKIGILGITGYAGMQLIGLLKKHPQVNIRLIGARSLENRMYSDKYKKYKGFFDKQVHSMDQFIEQVDEVDLVFLALPHTISMQYAQKIISKNKNVKIIDFSGDFRLNNVTLYEKNYNIKHCFKEYLDEFIYGLPEINRNHIKKSNYIANPGCYPTSIILPLFPLIQGKQIEKHSIIADSKSGLSGAGKKMKESLLFSEAVENIYAYNTGTHRHQAEITAHLGLKDGLLFSPHIVPTTRGIFSTIYCQTDKTEEELYNYLKNYYLEEPFVHILKDVPNSKDVSRTNNCFISVKKVSKKQVVIYSTIDNLMKGASSQAVQNMNLLFGFDETLGLNKDIFYI